MDSAMTRRSPRLIAAASISLLAGGCSVSPAASLEPAGVPRASAPATTGSQATPTGNPVDPTASAAVSGQAHEAGWYRVTAPFGDPSTATWLDGVIAWRSQFVAFGRVTAPGRNQLNELAALLLSDTGETWRSVPIDAGVGPEDASTISLVAAGARGIALFGSTCCSVEGQAIWYSSDGEAWERVPVEPSVFDDSEIAAVQAGDAGFVAVGSRSGRAAIWTSNDGRNWAAVGAVEARLGGGAVRDVVRANGRWLAAGYEDDGDTYDGATWESDDGFQWRRLPAEKLFGGELDTAFERLYASPGGVLLIGNEGPNDERVECEKLLGQTASVASGSPPETAISCGWGVETHWWSSDGGRGNDFRPSVRRLASSRWPGPGRSSSG